MVDDSSVSQALADIPSPSASPSSPASSVALTKPARRAGKSNAGNRNPKPKRDKWGRFPAGLSGNPHGPPDGYRKRLNAGFLQRMCADFEEFGPEAIARVRQENPAVYIRVLALLVPREMKIETTGSLKSLSDEQLDAAIAAIKGALEERERQVVDVTPSTRDE